MYAPAQVRVHDVPPFDAEVHGGGLTETQRAEQVISYDEPTYGFVRMAAEALRDAGAIPRTQEEEDKEDDDNGTDGDGGTDGGGGGGTHLLERLHVSASAGALQAVGPKNNPFLTPLQNTLRKSAEFQSSLHAFVKTEVCPALGVRRVAYQRRPTFRVHLAGGPPQGVPHADGLAPYNHQPGEVNVWVPLTSVRGSNSLVAESSPGLGDFHSFVAQAGQFVKFYGNRCWHYTVANTTQHTRVSFDIRVVPFELFDGEARGPSKTVKIIKDVGVETGTGTGTGGKTSSGGGKPLRLGEYYVECSVDE